MLIRLALTFVIVVASMVADITYSVSECGTRALRAGLCTTNTGSAIEIGGSQTTPGGSPGDAPGRGDGNRNPRGGSSADDEPSDDPCASAYVIGAGCRITYGVGIADDPLAMVTITDLVRFAPTGSALVAEPFGFGVVGLPSNFVVASGVHTASGSLFGRSVQVRFTPDQHRFDYGDGTVRTLPDPGATWEAAGLAQFTPTATSHAYGFRGSYTTRVDVLYTAEVNFGSGWVTVPGHVTSTGRAAQVQVFEARTALVAHTCTAAPTAPGC